MSLFRKKIIVFLILLLKTKTGFSATIDTTNLAAFPQSVYVETPVTFYAGDFVKGFVAFKNGFIIDSGATIPFGSVGTVDGIIDLGGGTLQLTNDLYLGTNASINGGGNIDLQGYSIFLSAFTLVQGPVNIISTGSFIGNGNTLDVSAAYLNLTAAAVLFYDMKINGLSAFFPFGLKTLAGNVISLSNVTLQMINYMGSPYVLDANIAYHGDCHISGISSTMSCQGSIFSSDQGASLSIDEHTTLRLNSTGISIQGSMIAQNFQLNNSTLEIGASNTFINNIIFTINGNSRISSLSPSFQFKIGDSGTNVRLVINPGSKLIVDDNTTIIYQCPN